jgi:hypothetical protein
MKLQFIVLAITAFLIINTYYDGKFTKLFTANRKVIKMATFGFVGLSLLLFMKRNPGQTKEMLVHANDMIKYMPVSKGTMDILTPFFDFTNNRAFGSAGLGGAAGLGVATGLGGAGMARTGFNTPQTNTANLARQQSEPQKERNGLLSSSESRIMNSGRNSSKRSVSESKKKYVAAMQGWKCGDCERSLPAWFEVDHVISLEHGGSNHIDNLKAVCRDCHGKKTMLENF